MVTLALIAVLCLAHEPTRIDLDADAARQVVVDHEPGTYLGHVSTLLLEDRATILAAYPKGHGKGPIVLKRSVDGGRTWSDRLATPETWATSQETPTLFGLGGESLILFSGLYPIRAARSSDSGTTWSELEPIGDFGGIVAMGGVVRRGDEAFTAFFHDDGRFIRAGGTFEGMFTLYQTDSNDGGLTWSQPRTIWAGTDVHLCEPGVVWSPDGETLAILLRENRRVKNSHVMFSGDRAATWTEPRELPAWLTGDRHIAVNAPDGRIVVTFRFMARNDPWWGDWVAWIGDWDHIVASDPAGERSVDADAPMTGKPGARRPMLVRLKDNLGGSDCGYAGLEVLPDGTFVGTTYGTWAQGEKPSILCVRFTLEELDARLRDGE